MDITKEQFEVYEKLRWGGKVNVFDAKTVEAITGLAKDEILTIMQNYETLQMKYLKKDSE